MTEQQEIMTEETSTPSWDNATRSDSRWVKFVEKQPKRLVLTNWKLVLMEKFGKEKTCFVADVLKEDDTDLGDKPKCLESSSSRLNAELRPFFEGKQPDDQVAVEVTMVGSSYDTQYVVRGI